jgi:uncharacterized protein
MSTTGIKIVIDTNIFIATIGKQSPYRWIFEKILSGEFILCVSNDIVLEYHEILSAKTTPDIARNVTDFLVIHPYVQHIEIFFQWRLIRSDDDDNKFIDCAISSDAFCIVSNDRHFQEAKESNFPKVQVLTVSEFSKLFNL